MKTLLLALLVSFSSLSLANSLQEHYPIDAPENTALFVAIAKGNFEKAEKLLEAGVNPNAKSVKGATVFTALALNDDEPGSIDFLPTLIKYNADINNQDDIGYAGLVLAILAGKFKLLYSLIQNGADIFTTDKDGFNILHMIARFCDSADFKNPDLIDSLNFIFSKVNQSFIDTVSGKSKSTPLHIAVKGYNLEFVRILDEKADVNNIPDTYKNTPVMVALLYLNKTVFELGNAPQDINSDKVNKIQTLSDISSILLNSLSQEDLNIRQDNNESANSVLSALEQNLTYIKNNQTQIPELSSLHNASRSIRNYLSRS